MSTARGLLPPPPRTSAGRDPGDAVAHARDSAHSVGRPAGPRHTWVASEAVDDGVVYVVRRPRWRARRSAVVALLGVLLALPVVVAVPLLGGGPVAPAASRLPADRNALPAATKPAVAKPAEQAAPGPPTTKKPAGKPTARATAARPTTPVKGAGRLTSALSTAFSRARTAAAAAGVDLVITSGYRSPATQQRLYERAVAKYGSERLARRWVLPPDESGHVAGTAVDVGPRAAGRWLEKHGARWGLCRRYANEWWHFELLVDPGGRCPATEPYAGG